jgi:short-subunit dehydrogenase
MGPYNVSKAGVVALSETLYAELRPHGVGVTVLCPGFVPTNLLAEARFARPEQRLTAERLMRASRLSTDDVAKAAIEGVRRGRLYVVLPGRARIFWRLKRLMPTAMMKLVSWVARRDAAITPPQPSNTCPSPLSHSGASTSEARSSSHAKS